MRKVIVVGAGIGGMITAGLLAKRGFAVTLFERSNIPGGRSHVFQKNGFTMSYGAHAVIAPNDRLMKSIVTELNIRLNGNGPDNKRFFLFVNDELAPGLVGPGLLTSKALSGLNNRLSFLLKFIKLIRSKPIYDSRLTLGEWIHTNVHDRDVAVALRAYAALTTYDGGVDKYPMNAFVKHARMMYSSSVPLMYVNFGSFLNTLEQAVLDNGGDIQYGKNVTELIIHNSRISGVVVDKELHEADIVVLNVPPQHLVELSSDSVFQAEIQPVLNQPATFAFVYDVLLDRRIRNDVNNVLDPERMIYINDMSLNCPSTSPNGTQMLNCLKLLSDDDHDSKQMQAEVEHVLAMVYPNWTDHVVHRRIINRAMVQGISNRVEAHKLPVRSRVEGLFYVGDSTNRTGAFSIPAYDSALYAANLIANWAYESEDQSWKTRQKAN